MRIFYQNNRLHIIISLISCVTLLFETRFYALVDLALLNLDIRNNYISCRSNRF